MTAVVTTVEVDRAAPEVFAYATDPGRFREWQQGVVDGHLDSGAEPAVGEVVRGQARKEMPANLARLKARLETGSAAESQAN